jgi:DNA-binding transcriptional MerR regulator
METRNMRRETFDFYSISDAAIALKVDRANLRYWIDMGGVPCRRASDGTRLLTHDDLKAARRWIDEHESAKEQKRKARKQARATHDRMMAKRRA